MTTFNVGDRVRFVPAQERRGEAARPDQLTASYVGTVIDVRDQPGGEYLIEFDAPPVREFRSRRATYGADALEAWPPA